MSTNIVARQMVRSVVADLGPSNMGAGNGFTAKLPQGAVLARLIALTITAFNSATTSTLTVTDGTTVFVNAVDVQSTGSETVANAPKFYPAGGELQFNLAETGAAATAGRVVVIAEYYSVGIGDEVYG
ncbi:hypothetical protein [uncultured Arenimonas sp.]|uniref:hypothetical protein n=1 Tax=uncultured Arenimonas sp. TaxID=546226 RepID=UPI0030D8D67A